MYRIIQKEVSGKMVQAYVDSFILTSNETAGSVKYLSMFGSSVIVKALIAQIIENNSPNLVNAKNQYIVGNTGTPVKITRGFQHLRVATKALKPGITHKIIFSEEHFKPWKKKNPKEFLTFGNTIEKAKERAFKVIDKITTVPLKPSWINWLWRILTEDADLPVPILGGQDEILKYAAILRVPNSDWLETQIKENLEELKQI